MIKSFADRETGRLWETGNSRRISPVLRQRTMDKLQMLDAAANVDNLRVPPSNRLEKLSGDRAGSWSIRINKQYRIAFRFANGDAYDVEFADYH
jgi:proteic killer suppression protein